MSEWQPIETAPKDVRVVDVWAGSRGRIANSWWTTDWPFKGGSWVYREGKEVKGIYHEVTHWMPLPDPPK